MEVRSAARVPRARVLVGALALLVTLLGAGAGAPLHPRTAHAATCGAHPGDPSYPNDPQYSPAEQNPVGSQTWDGEAWYLYDCIPQQVQATSSDPEGASGMSVDVAWQQYSKGRDDVVVAYMEGGVNWRIPSSCELRLRSYLNRGELPYPQNAAGKTRLDLGQPGDPYDLNGDGAFNVDDYLNDPRVQQALVGVPKSPVGGPFLHHVCSQQKRSDNNQPVGNDITPEDLIVAFGHCRIVSGQIVGAFPCDPSQRVDNDGNGYPNDISGWNFNRDTNDPQTDQSIYAHFNDESAQAVGEGNNGFGGTGMCPQCRYLPIKAGDEAIDRPDRVAEAIVFAVDSGVAVFDGTDASLGLTPEVAAAVDYAYHRGVVVVWASNDFESADHTDGMWLPHVWPGNSVTGDHSTRGGAQCPQSGPLCPFVLSNTTFRSRSSLTSYGPHSLFSVPNNDGSTSTGTPTQAGVAALVVSEGLNAADQAHPALNADEVKQVVRSTASPISAPCPNCFSGAAGSFNRMYGYGRPNVFLADQAVANHQVPPTVDIRTPTWYQEVDPFTTPTLHVTADVAARRAAGYTWRMQFATGPDPSEADFATFANGVGTSAQTVGADLDLTQLRAGASAPYAIDSADRTSIETYDVTIRVQVVAPSMTCAKGLPCMGEDRRAFHARHDSTERPGFPVRIGVSGDAPPTMADIEGRGWLDTIMPTAEGDIHAIRPDGTEAPGFPVHTAPPPGMNPSYPRNYLQVPEWRDHVLPRPGDPILSAAAVGDLRHDGALEIVVGTLSGLTYAWDGAGRLLPGFPLLDGSPADYTQSVPPPDTPYSFNPENVAGPSPVLADLTGDHHLDIIQAAGDDHVYAWHVDRSGVSPVPGWPVCTVFDPAPGQTCVERATDPKNDSTIHTHDVKIVPTPAIVDVNGDGIPDVVVGLDDSTFPNNGQSAPVTTYLEAFDGRGTAVSPTGQMQGWPVSIPGLLQGYGVAQDFVTQGTESPVVVDTPAGPQIVVNSNLFLPVRVDARTRNVSGAFAGASIPPPSSPNPTPNGALVQFTTSPSAGQVLPGALPQIFQAGSTAVDVASGITQTPGAGIRVDNGVGAWDLTTGATLPQYDQYMQGLGFFTAPAIADVTGDGTPDILQAGDSAALTGIDGATGSAASGFPKWTGGFSLFTPAVGDVDARGTVAVAEMTREGYLHMWQTPGLTSANHQAWHWHQDDRNTGHYGTDTRPPSAIADLAATCSSSGDTLTFTAPGDDWSSGTATSYQVFRSSSPITQDTLASATPVPVTVTPHAAGAHETLTIPDVPGQCNFAVRAVDKAGNIGPIRVSLAGGGSTGTGTVVTLPNTSVAAPSGGALTVLAVAGLAGTARRRRRAAGSRSRR